MKFDFVSKKFVVLGVGASLIILALLIGFFSCFSSVKSGHIGIVTAFGQVDPQPLSEGLHPISPWKSVTLMNVRLQSPSSSADSASKDLQKVHTQVTVPYTITASDGAKIFQKVGNLDRIEAAIINPGIQESTKAVTAQFSAEHLITQREVAKTKIDQMIREYVAHALEAQGLKGAITIGSIAVTDFQFSPEFNKSIEQKVQAEQDALRAENEKRKKITEAEGDAESKRKSADGEAYAIEKKSIAEAAAIKRKADALSSNPRLVDLNAVEKWNGQLPNMMGGGAVPFINVNPGKQ
jgi:regulator of protease activity HflC (stomatin/prohibitin superfamily)